MTAPPFSIDQHLQLFGRQHGIERDLRASLGESDDFRFEVSRRAQIGKLRQIGFGLDRQLALVHEQQVRAFGGKHGEAQRQRRVRHVAAADVERPGDRGRVGQHRVRRALLGDRRGEPRQLVLGQFAGIGDRVDLDRSERRLRLVMPQGIDRIRVKRNQRRAGFLGGGRQRADVA